MLQIASCVWRLKIYQSKCCQRECVIISRVIIIHQ